MEKEKENKKEKDVSCIIGEYLKVFDKKEGEELTSPTLLCGCGYKIAILVR